MFGEAIEQDIRTRTKNDKNANQTEAKVRMILHDWLSWPDT